MGYARQRARRLGLRLVSDGTVTTEAKAKRFAARDECCCWCGGWINTDVKTPDPMSLEWAHMTALSGGGSHSMSNLEPAHRRCNQRQGIRDREEQVCELVDGLMGVA